MELKIKNVRVAFPELFKPKAMDGGDPKYSASFLIEPSDAQCKAIEKMMKDVAIAKWGTKGEKIFADLKAQARVCFRDGDSKSQYAGFEGMMYISASNDARPLVVDRKPKKEDGTPNELTAADGRPYSGCYVNATLDVWAQDNKYGKRINATLTGVQFVKDGDAFSGGRPASADDFDDLSDGTEEDLDDVA